MKIKFLITLLGFFLVNILGAQEAKLNLEKIYQDNFLQTSRIPGVRWAEDGNGYYVLENNAATRGQDIVHYDPLTASRKVVINSSQLIPPGESRPLRVSQYSWSHDTKKLLIFTNTRRVWRYHTKGDYWVLDIASGELRQLGNGLKTSSLMFAKFSPIGSSVAYVSEHNIFTEDLASGQITQLTFDGGERFINGTFDWVYEEDWGCRDGFRWSPDGQFIAYWHSDTDQTGTFFMINNIDSVYSTLIPLPYPKAGTTNSSVKIGVVSAKGGLTEWLDIPGDPRNHYLVRMDFIPGSNEMMIQQMNRLQNVNTVWGANAEDLSLKVILTESDKTWVELHDNTVWMDDSEYFTWTSERHGWRHLYRVSRDGKSMNPITRGEFDVISVEHIDTKGGYVYFIASPDNFTQRYLYRSPLDGSQSLELISPKEREGQHRYQISPDASFAIHTFENSKTPPVISLISLPDHQQIQLFEDNAHVKSEFESHGGSGKKFINLDIGDIMLDAWMIKPANFDPSLKYPLIFYVYGEPASATVQDNWAGGDLWHQYLAQEGYIVVSIDNRGTASPRGREWRKEIYGQIGIQATHDQALAAETLFEAYPFIDQDRVGIWGWSGGGSMTLNCMFRYPEIYKTGIAVAFVSDQKLYNTVYQERYMGLPQGNPTGYQDGSPLSHSQNLSGELLLIHGTADDNVHYQSLELLVDKLVAHGKIFDMLAYPMRAHGISERANTGYHLRKSMFRFWQQHLPPGPR